MTDVSSLRDAAPNLEWPTALNLISGCTRRLFVTDRMAARRQRAFGNLPVASAWRITDRRTQVTESRRPRQRSSRTIMICPPDDLTPSWIVRTCRLISRKRASVTVCLDGPIVGARQAAMAPTFRFRIASIVEMRLKSAPVEGHLGCKLCCQQLRLDPSRKAGPFDACAWTILALKSGRGS